jgi:excisionase family DNA binding protein
MMVRFVMAKEGKVEPDDTLCISVTAAARLLGVSRNTGYEMAKMGQLPIIRCGQRRLMVPKAALLKMLQEGNRGNEKGNE